MIAAFFDIDGTIFRNSLLTEHFKKLIKYDLLDFSEYDRRVKEAFKLWDERVGNYDNYLGDLTGTYVDAIKGLPTKYNDFVADKVVELKGNKVYAYTRKMIKWHKAQGHLVIFISGSPDFLVSRMAKKWNADDFCVDNNTSIFCHVLSFLPLNICGQRISPHDTRLVVYESEYSS